MFIATLLISSSAAAQPAAAPTAPAQQSAAVEHRAGRFFVSPVGEPFYGRVAGEDGLVVWFQQADTNHDGSLTAVEMAADAERFFHTLDRNSDGEIDPDEIAFYEEHVAPQLRAESIVSETRLPGGEIQEQVDDESSSGRFGLLRIPEPVSSADANFNRGVSLQELRDAAVARFHLLDTANVGRLMLPDLVNIRRAAGNAAQRRRNGGSNPADNPGSAEYGQPAPQP